MSFLLECESGGLNILEGDVLRFVNDEEVKVWADVNEIIENFADDDETEVRIRRPLLVDSCEARVTEECPEPAPATALPGVHFRRANQTEVVAEWQHSHTYQNLVSGSFSIETAKINNTDYLFVGNNGPGDVYVVNLESGGINTWNLALVDGTTGGRWNRPSAMSFDDINATLLICQPGRPAMIINASNPLGLVSIGSFPEDDLVGEVPVPCYDIARMKTRAYVSQWHYTQIDYFPGNAGGVHVLDLSNAAAGSLYNWTVTREEVTQACGTHASICPSLQGIVAAPDRNLVFVARYGCCADETQCPALSTEFVGELFILEDTGVALELVSKLAFPGGGPFHLAVHGNYVFVGLFALQQIAVVDTTNKNKPKIVATVDIPGRSPGQMVAAEHFLFVATRQGTILKLPISPDAITGGKWTVLSEVVFADETNCGGDNIAFIDDSGMIYASTLDPGSSSAEGNYSIHI